MPSILFVCTANRFRSPIAAAGFLSMLDKKGIKEGWHVSSAGTWTKPGLSALPSPEWSRDHLALDLTHHESRPVGKALLTACDLIVVMERNQKESLGIEFPEIRPQLFMLSQFESGLLYDIEDPVKAREQTQAAYLVSAQELLRMVRASFDAICTQARNA